MNDIKERLMSAADMMIDDQKIRKRLNMITLVCLIMFAAVMMKGASSDSGYIVDEDGNVVGLYRKDADRTAEYDLDVEMSGKGVVSRDNVRIRTRAAGGNNGKAKDRSAERDDTESLRTAELGRIVSEAENSRQKKIRLPSELSDGSQVKWKERRKIDSNLIAVPLLYLSLCSIVVAGGITDKKSGDRMRRAEILRGLLRFTNQLMLMMNAGMILSDSFTRICSSYEYIPKDKRNFFEESLINLKKSNAGSRVSTAELINEYAGRYSVKELVRIATILTENERRGSNVVENLERESRFLWENRKITAREKGKLIDTKMAYPMGLLLMLLIVITMAPAMMAM